MCGFLDKILNLHTVINTIHLPLFCRHIRAVTLTLRGQGSCPPNFRKFPFLEAVLLLPMVCQSISISVIQLLAPLEPTERLMPMIGANLNYVISNILIVIHYSL